MPNLDFLTPYIIIFLNSLTVCVVWAAFAVRYRPNDAALHSLAGMALIVVDGAVLAIQGTEGSMIPAIYRVIGKLTTGTKIEVQGCQRGRCKLQGNRLHGYISVAYVNLGAQSQPNASPPNSPQHQTAPSTPPNGTPRR